MNDVATRCDQACEILRATSDGDELEPQHLYLVQCAVNGVLSELGEQEFQKLLAQVRSPEGYKRGWYFGIENLTLHHSGYVFWRGVEVEHYSFHDDNGNYGEKAKESALELARRCLILESKGIVPDTNTAIWQWKEGE